MSFLVVPYIVNFSVTYVYRVYVTTKHDLGVNFINSIGRLFNLSDNGKVRSKNHPPILLTVNTQYTILSGSRPRGDWSHNESLTHVRQQTPII